MKAPLSQDMIIETLESYIKGTKKGLARIDELTVTTKVYSTFIQAEVSFSVEMPMPIEEL